MRLSQWLSPLSLLRKCATVQALFLFISNVTCQKTTSSSLLTSSSSCGAVDSPYGLAPMDRKEVVLWSTKARWPVVECSVPSSEMAVSNARLPLLQAVTVALLWQAKSTVAAPKGFPSSGNGLWYTSKGSLWVQEWLPVGNGYLAGKSL